ncbi:MAG: polysaccharide biosynthesis protein [Ruminococcaceae bacterium]|nr:polysaccharide biosynthesis protein [Oscillospiraceae bacterium]
MKTETKGSFLQGAFILTISTALVKIAGLLFTIPIANLLGGTGMGYFYTAYDIYNMLAVLASAGLPVAVSRMVSETLVNGNRDEADRIYKVSVRIFTVIGAVIAAVMFFGADILAELLKNPNSALSIRVLSFTAFFSFIMSSMRGYFQGHSIMTYTAVSQVIEAVCKLVLGCALAYVLMATELSYAGGSAGAILGVSVGAALSVLFLWFNMRKMRKNREPSGLAIRSDGAIIKELFRIAVPVSLGASVMSVVNLIDTAVIMRVLQDGLGYTYERANWLYGVFGNAKKIFNFPSAFIVPFTVSILPVLTAAVTAKNKEKIAENMTNCFKFAFMVSMPAGVGIMVLANPIMNIIYFNTPDEANAGAPMLAVFGLAVILYSVVSITNAILQAFGKVNYPLISLCTGAVVKCVLNAVLLGVASINIMGAPIATCVCYVVMIAMNFAFLGKYMTNLRSVAANTAKVLLSSLVMGGAAYGLYALLADGLGVKLGGLVSIAGAGVVYVVMLFVFRAVTVAELKGMLKRR